MDLGARSQIEAVGLDIKDVSFDDEKRTFKVRQVNGSTEVTTFRAASTSIVEIEDDKTSQRTDDVLVQLSMPIEQLPGLSTQIEQLASIIVRYNEGPHHGFSMPESWRARARGVILHGPAGTGKTRLMNIAGKAGWRSVITLKDRLNGFTRPSERAAAVRKAFAEAKSRQPSLIVIDDFHNLFERSSSEQSSVSDAVSEALRHEVEQLQQTRTLVIASTRSLNSIDRDLRNSACFTKMIEVPVPTMLSRTAILKKLAEIPSHEPDALLEYIASRTHGFVGEDLGELSQTALDQALHRMQRSEWAKEQATAGTRVRSTLEDYETALKEVKPTAMREIFVETPRVKWDEIGGQQHVKEALQESLLWPFEVSSLVEVCLPRTG